MSMKWGLRGRGPVAIVTDGVNNSAKQFLSVSVITGGTNKNVSNNVKNFPFWRYHTTFKKQTSCTNVLWVHFDLSIELCNSQKLTIFLCRKKEWNKDKKHRIIEMHGTLLKQQYIYDFNSFPVPVCELF